MSIIYNGKSVAGKYNISSVTNASDISAGIIKIATEDELLDSLNNETAITPHLLNEVSKRNLFNNSRITNCITEIPQDIKLELNDGVLTLKAGSKVYVPNGFEDDGVTPKFDEIVIESDLSDTYIDGKPYCFFSTQNGTSHTVNQVATCNSGNTDTGTGWHVWYNTSTNKIIRYNGDGEIIADDCSLPICIYSGETTITSIDQTFNGFGYIGSTMYILPNVKMLLANGRNQDGTLKNEEYTQTYLITATRTWNSLDIDAQIAAFIIGNGLWFWNHYIESDIEPDIPKGYAIWYNPKTNKTKLYNANLSQGTWEDCNAIYLNLLGSNGTTAIADWNIPQPFRAVVYSDKPEISGWSLPSSKYINLTVGASGTTYKAPTNGWVRFTYTVSSQGGWGSIENTTSSVINGNTGSYWTGGSFGLSIPVKKGDVFKPSFDGVNNQTLRFIYAEGEI